MSRQISIILVDDEVSSLGVLQALLGQQPEVALLGAFTQAQAALDYLIEYPNRVDLLLLDIEMPDMNGLEFCKLLQKYALNPCVAFVTGHGHFAIEALRAEAFDFLLKPVAREDITAMLQRYKLRCIQRQLAGKTLLSADQLASGKLVFSHHRGIFAWHPDDIFYIIADGNYSNIHLISGKNQLVTMQIGKIEEMTTSAYFYRINRSTLINLKYFEFADQKEKTCTLAYNGFSKKFCTSVKKIREIQDLFLGRP